MDDDISQFFAPDNSGNSQQIYKTVIDGLESLKTSEIRARNRQFRQIQNASILIDGIPNIPFERTIPNPDLFFQGEDIIYDVLLLHNGEYVSSNDYDIIVAIKKTPRDSTTTWEGFLDNGIYADTQNPGSFEIWIPSAATGGFLAGTYYLQILLKEKLGKGKGRFDRQYVVLQTYFNIDYGNFSPAPESRKTGPGQQLRNTLEATWPNAPDTVGKTPIPDVIGEKLGMQ